MVVTPNVSRFVIRVPPVETGSGLVCLEAGSACRWLSVVIFFVLNAVIRNAAVLVVDGDNRLMQGFGMRDVYPRPVP